MSKNDSGCDEVISTAIAEVSKDFLAGLQASAVQNQYGDSDESRISSDTEFKLICGGMPAYARYPESAAGLSDTDWNPYGTESDNNQSPHLQTTQSLARESKSSAISPFQPIFNSTGVNMNTPCSGDKAASLNTDSHLSDIKEVSERQSTILYDLKPDATNESQRTRLTDKPAWATTPMKAGADRTEAIFNKTLRGQDLEMNPVQEKGVSAKGYRDPQSSKESGSSDEEKRLIASTSSTGYSSGTSGVKGKVESNKFPVSTRDPFDGQHLSVFERAKLLGIPEDILFDKPQKHDNRSKIERILSEHAALSDYESDDILGKKVRTILTDTAHLSGGESGRIHNRHKSNVDYGMLQKDLQDLEDNLESLSSESPRDVHEHNWNSRNNKSPLSTEKDDDNQSTMSTPERNRSNPLWDFAEVIGSLANRINDEKSSHRHRLRTKKMALNSDGDETQSTDSGHKSDDQIGFSEQPDNLQSSLKELKSSQDIDQMLSTFKDQRQQLESRYQQLSNQGLAEKVFRILTSQDPEGQADGILKDVSADEKEMRTQIALKKHNRDFNFSSNSSLMEDSQRSFGLPDDIRKRLDLSGLSSVDSSRNFDRSSFNMPASSKGFSAFDGAKRLLSSQVAKASERTFNHSIEMRYPQTIQCYPLFVESIESANGKKTEQEDRESAKRDVESAHESRREDSR